MLAITGEIFPGRAVSKKDRVAAPKRRTDPEHAYARSQGAAQTVQNLDRSHSRNASVDEADTGDGNDAESGIWVPASEAERLRREYEEFVEFCAAAEVVLEEAITATTKLNGVLERARNYAISSRTRQIASNPFTRAGRTPESKNNLTREATDKHAAVIGDSQCQMVLPTVGPAMSSIDIEGIQRVMTREGSGCNSLKQKTITVNDSDRNHSNVTNQVLDGNRLLVDATNINRTDANAVLCSLTAESPSKGGGKCGWNFSYKESCT
jgi:hypothetical protein